MNERGVSVTLNYVLTLAITTLLVSGLLFAASDIVNDRRASATRAELDVVGQHVAAELLTADRLAQSGASTVVVDPVVPEQIAGSQYTISIDAERRSLVLETADPTVVVSVPLANTTSLSTSTASSTGIRVELVGGGGSNPTLEVRSP